jgi:hypothetical protein
MGRELSRVELILALAALSEEFRRDLLAERAGVVKQLVASAELSPSEAALLEAPSRAELEATIAAIRPTEASVLELGVQLTRALVAGPPLPPLPPQPPLPESPRFEPIAVTGIRPDVAPEPPAPWWKRLFRRR